MTCNRGWLSESSPPYYRGSDISLDGISEKITIIITYIMKKSLAYFIPDKKNKTGCNGLKWSISSFEGIPVDVFKDIFHFSFNIFGNTR